MSRHEERTRKLDVINSSRKLVAPFPAVIGQIGGGNNLDWSYSNPNSCFRQMPPGLILSRCYTIPPVSIFSTPPTEAYAFLEDLTIWAKKPRVVWFSIEYARPGQSALAFASTTKVSSEEPYAEDAHHVEGVFASAKKTRDERKNIRRVRTARKKK